MLRFLSKASVLRRTGALRPSLRLSTRLTVAAPRALVSRVLAVRSLATASASEEKSKKAMASSSDVAKLVDTGVDMMVKENRDKARAARRQLLPTHDIRAEAAPELYVNDTTVANLKETDLHKFIKIPDVEALPEALRHGIREELEYTGDYLMVRRDIFGLLKALREGKLKQQGVLIDGGRGVGKTAALALAVQQFQQSGALVLATRGEEFLRDRYGQIAPSKVREGILDQPRYTLRYLRNLRDTQPDQLKAIKLKQTYSARIAVAKPDEADDEDADEKAAAPKAAAAGETRALETLYDLVSYAGSSRLAAAKHWYDIVSEIRQATEVEVVIACDGVNWWDHKSELRDPITTGPIRGRRLALVDGFLELLAKPPVNGTALFAMTTVARDKWVEEYEKMSTVRLRLVGYNDLELANVIRHYSVSKMIVSKVDRDYMTRIKALSGNVPTDVFEMVMAT